MNDTIMNAGGIVGVASMCVVIGRVLKSIPRFPDDWIPTALALAGIAMAVALGDTSSVVQVLSNAMEGAAAGLAAVGANQAYRQHTQEEKDKQ